MDKNLFKRFVILASFLVVLFGGIFGWRVILTLKNRAEIAKRSVPEVTVSAAVVKKISWSNEVEAAASLQAIQGAVLTPQLAGMVTGIDFLSGTKVKKEQLLVQLNDATQQAQLQNDKAVLKLNQAVLAQQQKLYRNGNTSWLALQQAEAAKSQAEAAVSSDHAMIAKLQIRAPFSGQVGLRLVSLGQYVDTTTPVVDIQQWTPIYAQFQLPQQYLPSLINGQPVTLTVVGFPGREFIGKITAIEAELDAGTRNVAVQATFQNTRSQLRPGMYGEVTVNLGQSHQEIVVPDSAISYNTYGQYVYIVQQTPQGMIANERSIEIGESRGDLTIVTRGLKSGDRVVTAGQVKLRSGSPVEILSPAIDSDPPPKVYASGSG